MVSFKDTFILGITRVIYFHRCVRWTSVGYEVNIKQLVRFQAPASTVKMEDDKIEQQLVTKTETKTTQDGDITERKSKRKEKNLVFHENEQVVKSEISETETEEDSEMMDEDSKQHEKGQDEDKMEKPDYTCYVCGRVLHCNAALINHFRTHTGERPYKCEVCDKTYTREYHLTEHKRTHTGENHITVTYVIKHSPEEHCYIIIN